MTRSRSKRAPRWCGSARRSSVRVHRGRPEHERRYSTTLDRVRGRRLHGQRHGAGVARARHAPTGADRRLRAAARAPAATRRALRRARHGTELVARAMPNTPGAIGEGFTGWTCPPGMRERHGAAIAAVLDALGKHAYFADEKYLDMVTAVSGSGPGYIMMMIEALIDAAVLIGLRRDIAREMVLQTVAGAARYAQITGEHPAVLRDAVTSPGGTTAAGLQRLEEAGVRAALMSAVVAAWERSRALGG